MDTNIGAPRNRVDGRAKVTGAARYAAEFATPEMARAYVVSAAITRGRITKIDTGRALAVPGVIEVFTHENRPRTAWFDSNYQDQVAPPGSPFRALYDAKVHFAMQPVALVVADDFDTARHAATLVHVEYDDETPHTDLAVERAKAYEPPKKRSGISPVMPPRGNVEKLAESAVTVANEYPIAAEYHHPMEPHATTVVYDDGKIVVHDKTQGVVNDQAYIANVFSLKTADVQVVAPYVGGAFGSGLRPHYQVFLTVMAALALKRSVRLELTRDQMFTHVHRPTTINALALGASADGKLQAIRHTAIQGTSHHEDYQENVVNWAGLAYACDNVAVTYQLAKLDTATPGDMRAPGSPTGFFALESAMDELAAATGIDPLELRLRNYSERDQTEDKEFTSKALRDAYRLGAERFGWSKRSPQARSMQEGRELIGWGMATGIWEAQMQKTAARARLTPDGKLEIACSTSDIGTGTYTILAQIAADTVGVPMDQVTVKLADTALPEGPIEGGSWTAASAGAAVQMACTTLREKLFKAAGRTESDNVPIGDVIEDAMGGGKLDTIEAQETAAPDQHVKKKYSSYTHSVAFVEVRVDETLGQVRVTRVVTAAAAGKILNPKTARSQVIGGVVFGIGMALHEEAMTDHKLGRVMNHNLAEYHVPANADVPDIDVIFVEEHDDKTSPMGVKGCGEIGIVATPAAIANAIYHATGKRIRSLPITIDKVFGAL